MIVRRASPSVGACEGSCYAWISSVIFFRPTGHYVRDIYSVLLNIASVYHIVAICVI
jgi:hypothetical protein